MKKIIAIMLIICGLGLGFFVVPSFLENAPWNSTLTGVQKGNDEAVTERLSYVADLSILDYKYANACNYTDHRDFELLKGKLNIPFTKKQIVMLYEGDIKIGVDVEKITADVKKGISGNVKTVVVGLPPLKITSNDIDRGTIEFPIESDNILNGLSSSDYSKIEKAGKVKMAKAVKDNKVMAKAKNELKNRMKGYLTALYGEDVIVEFEDIK